MARLGEAGQGVARPGMARRGTTKKEGTTKRKKQNINERGEAGPGEARQGRAWRGEARQGKTKQERRNKMAELRFTIKGVTPLIMHNPAGSMKTGGTGLKRKEIPTPEAEAASARYLDGQGHLIFPAVGVRESLITGAKGYKIGRFAAGSTLSGAIILVEEWFSIYDEDGELWPDDRYIIDTRRAVVEEKGVMRSRAKLSVPWFLKGAFGFVPELAPLDTVRTVLDRAGIVVGIGDYRPEKRGWFGRYVVVSLEVV